MSKATVVVRHLNAPHQSESLTKFQPLNDALKAEVEAAVAELFDRFGGKKLLKESKEVFVKPNGIDGQPYCYTRPEVVEAVIRYWYAHGASKVWLFENSTQSNATRLVYAVVGYDKICKRTGAVPVYLDEDKTVEFTFGGKPSEQDDPNGYQKTTFPMPRFIVKNLIENRDKNLYIDLPKLKTHSMAGVTLGVKNQWAFPIHPARGFDHNFNLPYKLVDVLGYVRPDFTLIDGVEGTIYGHYPVTALADECVLPLKVLLGGTNVVATDLVGARIFGLDLADVPHLKLAIERGYSDGVKSLDDVEIEGDISMYQTKYPYDLYDSFPEDVKVIKGKTRCCKQGCQNNPLTLLQILYLPRRQGRLDDGDGARTRPEGDRRDRGQGPDRRRLCDQRGRRPADPASRQKERVSESQVQFARKLGGGDVPPDAREPDGVCADQSSEGHDLPAACEAARLERACSLGPVPPHKNRIKTQKKARHCRLAFFDSVVIRS